MFSSIQIKGLGAHKDTTIVLDSKVGADIEAPSESGKSLITDAILFGLLGCDRQGKSLPAEMIRDGYKSVTVALTIPSGTVITRRMTRARSNTRTIQRADDEQAIEYKRENDFAAALNGVCRKLPGIHAAHLIVSPFSWVPLAEGPGGGRPLVDMLASLVKSDARATVTKLMKAKGVELLDTTPMDLKAAETNRRTANKARDGADGELLEAKRAQPESTQTEAPTDRDARQVEGAAQRWTVYDGSVQAANRENAERAKEAERSGSYNTRLLALGKRPDDNSAAVSKAKKRRDDDAKSEDTARTAFGIAEAKIEEAKKPATIDETLVIDARRIHLAALDDLENGGEHSGTCPTCLRDGWEADNHNATLKETAVEAGKVVKKADNDAKRRLNVAHTRRAREIADSESDLKRATAILRAAEMRAKKSREEADALLGDSGSAVWDAAKAALGQPVAVREATAAPTEPTAARPTNVQLADAMKTIAAAQEAKGAAKEAKRNAAAATARLEAATTRAKTTGTEARYCDAVLEALRAEPGERLKAAMELLGEMGPVRLRVPDDGAIEVLIDDRAYWIASLGRRIYADACFRNALRGALRMRYMLMVVDECGSWSGEFDAMNGPVLWLRTKAATFKSNRLLQFCANEVPDGMNVIELG